jgi:hypothetical protein
MKGTFGGNQFATARASASQLSSAIFCANMTSQASSLPAGTKHKPRTGSPLSSSSETFAQAPCMIR